MSAITFNAAVTNHQLTAFSTWQGRRALFTVNLHNRPSFYLNNACLMVRMQYGEEMLLWSGTSADEAERLLGEVTKALKHAARCRIAFKSTLTLISAAVLATGLYAGIRGLDSTPVEIAPEITQAKTLPRTAHLHNPLKFIKWHKRNRLQRRRPLSPRQCLLCLGQLRLKANKRFQHSLRQRHRHSRPRRRQHNRRHYQRRNMKPRLKHNLPQTLKSGEP